MDGPLEALHPFSSSKKISACAWSGEDLDSTSKINVRGLTLEQRLIINIIWGLPLLSSSLSWNNKDLHTLRGLPNKITRMLVGHLKKT